MKQIFIIIGLIFIVTACKKTNIKPDITGTWVGTYSDGSSNGFCWQLKRPDSILLFFNALVPTGTPDEVGTWILNGYTFKATLQEYPSNNIYRDSATLSNDFKSINGVRFNSDGVEAFKFTLNKK